MTEKQSIVVIGGIEPSAKVGVLLDAKIASKLNFATIPVVTCFTHQDKTRNKVQAVKWKELRLQLEAVFSNNQGIRTVKIGVLPKARNIIKLAKFINKKKKKYNLQIIVDPIFKSSNNLVFYSKPKKIKPLFRIADFLTPNYQEAKLMAKIYGINYDNTADLAIKLERKIKIGLVIKGGHENTKNQFITDYLVVDGNLIKITNERLPFSMRGTGCIYTTALACYLHKGENIAKAINLAQGIVCKILTSN